MKEQEYKFRCEETDEIVWFSFDVMMTQKYGFVEKGGKTYRRIHDVPRMAMKTHEHGACPEILSDTLGFGQHQLAEFEADRKLNGFSGVEFVRDRDVPEFYQAKISSVKEWRRYVKHRGMYDKNSGNGSGVVISEDQMQAAKELVSR